MNIAQKIIEAHKLKFGSLPPLQQCSVSGSALFNADCMDILPLIPDKSVQLILADLPYGTTACKWDSILPLEKLWKEYNRIIKDSGCIVLFSAQPFTTTLISSNIANYKYSWVWDKGTGTNFQQVKRQPMRYTEDICVFSYGSHLYNPIITEREKPKDYTNCKTLRSKNENINHFHSDETKLNVLRTHKYPSNIISISSQQKECNNLNRLHPTQKPLYLMKYLIQTYSNENDMVLDNTMGVGTTCLGAKELNRKFIGIEKEVKYYKLAVGRVFGQHCH